MRYIFSISLLALVITLYLYIYVYMYICIYVYMYICIYIFEYYVFVHFVSLSGIFACIVFNTVWLCFVCQVGDSEAKVGGWLLRSQSASTCPCKVHFGGDSWKSSLLVILVREKLGEKETQQIALTSL